MSHSPEVRDPGMAWWQGAVCFLGTLVILVLLLGVVQLLADSISGTGALFTPPWVLVQVLVNALVFIGAALFAPALFKVPAFRWLKLNPAPHRMTIAAVLGMVGLGPVVDQLTYLLHSASPELFDTAALDLLSGVFESASPIALVPLIIAVAVGPGVGEELFFRGLVLRSFRASWTGWAAIAGSSILFGLMHMDPLHSAGAAVMGIYLGFVALRTGSVWPGVFAHGVNNLITALVAGLAPGDVVEIWRHGHPLWVVAVAAAVLAVSLVALVRGTAEDS